MFQIVKDNFLHILLVVVALLVLFYLIPPQVSETYNKIVQTNAARKQLDEKEAYLNNLRIQAEASAKKAEAPVKDGKKIYELEGAQFSGEASFAPLFEIVLNIAQNSGIRIRSIDYNYQPEEDKIYASHISDYNVCELTIVSVGTYSQLQNFFRGLMKDSNLSYIAEVEMQPWEKDKTILISNVKIRLYTKTPGAPTSVQIPKDVPAPAAPAMP